MFALTCAHSTPPSPDLSVPSGFSVKLFADNPLAPDIYTMTIDEAGRVLVAGRGYVRVLVDDNGEGVATRAIDLIDGLKDGPMGLLAEGDSLYVVSDGGLKRYKGYDGESKLKQPPETILALKTTGEHDAHAVRRGPDGWLYLLCGNSAGVKKETITGQLSPVKNPTAGALLRISPDDKQVEVVADGFRNAYSFDFNLDGEGFTADSDNERCVGLPWYESCRFYHVVPGGNYGWRSPQLGQFWRKPPYYVDCVSPVCYLGRGSPTGVACYRHSHFPKKYQGGIFIADWTFGRIQFVPLTPKQSSYEGEPETFAEAIGTSGFAPTALAVHPITGELFVSIGGRGTRGGVYRIAHQKSPAGKPLPMEKRSLEWTAADNKRWQADCVSENARTRRTTMELMARAGLKLPWTPKLKDTVTPNLWHPDKLVRLVAGRLVKPLVVPVGVSLDIQTELTIALMEVGEDPDQSLKSALAVLKERSATDDQRLQAIRIIQLALGDLTAPEAAGTVLEGYTLRKAPTAQQREAIIGACADILTFKRTDLEVEAFRMLACLKAPGHVGRALRHITAESDCRVDIGYLAVVARLEADRGPDRGNNDNIAEALLRLENKALEQKVPRDTFWPLRVTEIISALHKQYPTLGENVLKHELFGRPEHLLLVKLLDIPSEEAVKKFIAIAATEPNFSWTPGLVELLGNSALELAQAIFKKLSERPEFQEAVLRVALKKPAWSDGPKFIDGLSSFDAEIVRLSANALIKLDRVKTDVELTAAVRALRRLAPEDKAAREAVVSFLRHLTHETFGDDPKQWSEWVIKNRPQIVPFLATDGFDASAWKKREAGIMWDKGDATRGTAVFKKATCAACHDGGRALGPSLLGVAKRFSRDDLLTAILQPSKDVPARYRPVRITTTDEKTYLGMLVYEAQDGVILQTNADTSVRIAGGSIVTKRGVDISLMPAGLLDKLTDTEVADLLAYLKSLEEPKPK
jgi:putative heme-binding domain-containing protein